MKTLTWNQRRDFTDREWKLIHDYALQAAKSFEGKGITMVETRANPGALTIYGPVMQRGEPFVLSQETDELGTFECKTLSHPYGELGRTILEFASKNFPTSFTWGHEMDGLEEDTHDFQYALARARGMLGEQHFAGTDDDLVEALCAEFSYGDEGCRLGVNQARREHQQGKVTDLEQASEQCREMAAQTLKINSDVDFNQLVAHLSKWFLVGDQTARSAAEQAYREIVDNRALVSLIRQAKAETLKDQAGCRSSGNSASPTLPGLRALEQMRLEYHIGTLLGRAGGEWEVGLAIAERSLGRDDQFFQLARLAASAQADPDDDVEFDYCERAYRQEMTRRQGACQILGSYTRWREAALNFTFNLAVQVPETGWKLSSSSVHPFWCLDTFLRGNDCDRTVGDVPTVVPAVATMARHSEVLELVKPGSMREVARDYLNLLEVVDDLSIEGTLCTPEFKNLNRATWGTESTSAEMREDVALELEGSAMLGEATSQDVAIGSAGAFSLYQTGQNTPINEVAVPVQHKARGR